MSALLIIVAFGVVMAATYKLFPEKPRMYDPRIWDKDPEKREANFKAAMADWRKGRWH